MINKKKENIINKKENMINRKTVKIDFDSKKIFPGRSEKLLEQAQDVLNWLEKNVYLDTKGKVEMKPLYQLYNPEESYNDHKESSSTVIPPTKKTFAYVLKKVFKHLAPSSQVDFVYKDKSIIQGIWVPEYKVGVSKEHLQVSSSAKQSKTPEFATQSCKAEKNTSA